MADLNALIAQGAQFRQPTDPFAQYAQLQQLQAGQQANALQMMQMDKYQRDLQEQNALRTAIRSDFDPTNSAHVAEIYKAAPTLAPKFVESALMTKKTAGDIAKTAQETNAAKMKALGIGLVSAVQDPSDAGIDRALSTLDAQGIDTKPIRQQFASMTDPAQRKALITSYATQHPEGIAALNFVAPKPKEIRAGDKVLLVDENPNSPTFKQTLSSNAINLSEYEKKQLENEFKRIQISQGQLDVARGHLQQGAAGLGLRAREIDPFGLMGLPQSFGTGLAAPTAGVKPSAPTSAAAPAGDTSVSGKPVVTAVQSAIQQGLTGPDFIAALPAPLAKEVSAIIDHRAPPPNRFSKRGEQLTQLVMQADPTYDATQYGNKAAAEKQFTSGQLANSVRSFNVAQDHLSTLADLSTALKNNDTQAINRLSQFVAQQTGSAAPTNFDSAKRIVADEIVKAVIGGRGALGDRKAADETLSRANSPEQLMGVIDTYKKLINGQLGGFEKQYEVATGKKDFKTRFLTQAAANAGGPAVVPGRTPAPAVVPPFKYLGKESK